MTLAELVQLRRAEEQVSRAFKRGRHEKDRQAVTGKPAPKRRRGPSTCKIPGCGGPGKWRGWCAKHYARWRKGTL